VTSRRHGRGLGRLECRLIGVGCISDDHNSDTPLYVRPSPIHGLGMRRHIHDWDFYGVTFMKKALLTSIAALFLTGAAHAKEHIPADWYNWLPPAEYDKPFTGKLIIRRFETEEEIAQICKGTSRVACTARSIDHKTCYLFIANDDVIRRNRGSYAFTVRHELGHCNGWTQNHEGKRQAPINSVGMPTLPKDVEILPSYPPIVCVTPDWKQEPCKSRNVPVVEAKPSTGPDQEYQCPVDKPDCA